MKTVRFICRRCGHRFTAEVLEEGEAMDKKLQPIRIRCPKCGSLEIERG